MPRPSRLLVVEDDPAVRLLVVGFLEKDGYQVTGTATAASAEALLKKETFDLVLLDLGLPDEDGMVVARRLRASSTVPLVLVTCRSDDADKIAGLTLGADDYVTKPFNPYELSIRVRNILARTARGTRQAAEDTVRFGNWIIDLGRYTLTDTAGNSVPLTRAEFDILKALLLAGGRALRRDTLLDAVSTGNAETSDRNIDVLISRLRKKIEKEQRPRTIIVTVPGVGYRIGVAISRG